MRSVSFAVLTLFVWPAFGQDTEQLARSLEELKLSQAQLAAQAEFHPGLEKLSRSLEELKLAGSQIKVQTDGAELAAKLAGSLDALKFDHPLLMAQAASGKPQAQEDKARLEKEKEKALEKARSFRNDSEYQRGTRSIDRRDYEGAIQAFDRVVESKNARSDGALYWKAYAQNKMGRREQALATLEQLQKEYSQSRWLNDAKALEVEVRQASGRPVSPESEGDEDLKLLALNSLMQSDPDRSLPVIEKVLGDPKAAPKLKERALFVLAQSKDQRARNAVAAVAKGASNPDLQMKAVEYLGVFGRDNAQVLSEIYSSTNDTNVRRAVIRGFMHSRDKDRLLAVVKSETNPDLRRESIQMLGAMRAQAELDQLYRSESSPELRREILRGLMMSRDSDRLMEAAKSEKDPAVRREAIQLLGTMRDEKVAAGLVSLYSAESDPEAKRAVLDALFIQGNAKAIVDIARKETDPKLRQRAIERLSVMKSKEATDFMMEVLSK